MLSYYLYMTPAVAAATLAIAMQAWNIVEIKKTVKLTNGIIASAADLKPVRNAINLSMQLAMGYIALFLLLVLILAAQYFSGLPFGKVIAQLSVFGIFTLPVSIIGKGYEEKIRNMKIQTSDPIIKQAFLRYLVQWKEPRFKLPE